MKSAQYVREGVIELQESQPPPLGPHDVRVRVAYVGLCGTDLHIVHGHMDDRVAAPQVFGHEMSGTVDAVGDAVDGWQVGAPVTVMPLVWDGTCAACRAGYRHVCQRLEFIGIDSPGALQQVWTVPASTLVPLPAGLDLRTAALTEPLAVAVHDVRRGEVGPDDSVVVLGGGPVGLLIGLVARAVGARVLVAEPQADRRDRTARAGLEVVDPTADDLAARVDDWTGEAGADVVFEVSGSAAAVAAATGLAKVRGTVVIVAIHPQPRELDLHRVFWRELRLLGARVYERIDFERAVELLADGVVPADAVLSDVRPLDETAAACAELADGKGMKVLIAVNEPAP